MLCHLSEFPVSHRSVISSMGTLPVRPWKMRVFSDQYSRRMRGRLFWKRFVAWTCRFQKRFATYLCSHRGMNVWWEFTKKHVWIKFSIMPVLAFIHIHSCARTFTNKYDISSRIGCEFVYNIISYPICTQCFQPKRQSDNKRQWVNIYIIAVG